MLPTLLIAGNFIRTQWLVVAIMTAYLLGISGVFAVHRQPAETTFFLQWHSFYVLFLAMILAVSAIQSERKSRRIIAVLSKGIHRWQYLVGLLCGCGAIAGFFWIVIACTTLGLSREAGYPTAELFPLFVALFCCSLATTSVALFYSVFLHPLLATAATSATLLLGYLVQPWGWRLPDVVSPVSSIFGLLERFQLDQGGRAWGLSLAALIYAGVFLIAGSAIFARRDVTTSPE
jgi:ABC-type transport system involved in multi-copper enzyme maturation permease subunit